MEMIQDEVRFDFLCKAVKRKSKNSPMLIEGIASTGDSDLHKDVVHGAGMDIKYLLKKGKLNWCHKHGAEDFIGRIMDAKVTANGLWVQCELYKGNPTAERAFKTMADNDTHGWGFSVEGITIARSKANPKKIMKCQVHNIALTPNPINFNTYATLCKALSPGNETDSANMKNGDAMRTQTLDKKPKRLVPDAPETEEEKKKKRKTKKFSKSVLSTLLGEDAMSNASENLAKAIEEGGNEDLEKGIGNEEIIIEDENGEEVNAVDVTELVKGLSTNMQAIEERGEANDTAVELLSKGITVLLGKVKAQDELLKAIATELKVVSDLPKQKKSGVSENLQKSIDDKTKTDETVKTNPAEAKVQLDTFFDNGTLAKALGSDQAASNAYIQAENNQKLNGELLEKCLAV